MKFGNVPELFSSPIGDGSHPSITHKFTCGFGCKYHFTRMTPKVKRLSDGANRCKKHKATIVKTLYCEDLREVSEWQQSMKILAALATQDSVASAPIWLPGMPLLLCKRTFQMIRLAKRPLIAPSRVMVRPRRTGFTHPQRQPVASHEETLARAHCYPSGQRPSPVAYGATNRGKNCG
jgi:hypothetical protein